MLNSSFTFGIEIEFIGANTQQVESALRERSINASAETYNHNTRRHWKIVTDASLGYSDAGELVSPILCGESGLAELSAVTAALNTIPGINIDRRCGLHVHLAWDGMTPDQVKSVCKRYAAHESEIDGWMPRSRRGSARYSKTLDREYLRRIDSGTTLSGIGYSQRDRYFKVNTVPLTSYGTVEFRQHSGTTEYLKISNWVRFLVSFVEASCELSGSSATYTPANNNRAYAAIREQVENAGGSMEYVGRKWKVIGSNGVEKIYTIAELNRLHTGTNAMLPWQQWRAHHWTLIESRFAEFWNTHFPPREGTADEGVFTAIPKDVKSFFETRAAYFSQVA